MRYDEAGDDDQFMLLMRARNMNGFKRLDSYFILLILGMQNEWNNIACTHVIQVLHGLSILFSM